MKDLPLEDLLEKLPARYINHPFDELYILSITKSGGFWYVKYTREDKTDSYNQRQSIELKLAVIEMLNDLKQKNIKL